MKLKFNNSLEGVAKLAGIVLLAMGGLWLVGLLLRGIGGLVLGIVGLLATLLKFLLLAAVVIGLGYLLARVLLSRRNTLKNSVQDQDLPVDAQTGYVPTEPTEPRSPSTRLD